MIVNQNDSRVDEINMRLLPFQMSSPSILQPVFSMRSVSTRRDLYPCVERRRAVQEPIQKEWLSFNMASDFCAGNDMAPRNGYQVDVESVLQPRRGDNDDKSCYIPGSSSDLYNKPLIQGRRESQPFPNLWYSPERSTKIPDFVANEQGKQRIFNNNSRPSSWHL